MGRTINALAQRGPVTVISVVVYPQRNRSRHLAMGEVLQVFTRHLMAVDLMATAEGCISLVVDGAANLKGLIPELEALGTVTITKGRTIVAVVGEPARVTPQVTRHCFWALEGTAIDLISLGAEQLNLSFVVRQEAASGVLRALHAALSEEAGVEAQAPGPALPRQDQASNLRHCRARPEAIP